MTCREVADFLSEYLNRELPAREHGLSKSTCDGVQTAWSTSQSIAPTVTLGRHAFDDADAVERGVPEGLVSAILSAHNRERSAGS